MKTDEARQERARARQGQMTVRLVGLDDPDNGPPRIRGAEAVWMVTELTRRAWNLSGRSWPTYRREETPVRLLRRP